MVKQTSQTQADKRIDDRAIFCRVEAHCGEKMLRISNTNNVWEINKTKIKK